jgi:hypothetical protein
MVIQVKMSAKRYATFLRIRKVTGLGEISKSTPSAWSFVTDRALGVRFYENNYQALLISAIVLWCNPAIG